MKKTLLLLPAVLLLFATGCGQNSQSSSKSDSVRTSQSKKQAKKSSTSSKRSSAASKTDNASGSSSSVATPSSSANGTADATEQRYAALKQATYNQLGQVKWPANYSVNPNQYLNVLGTGDSHNYSLFFSQGNAALAYNDAGLQSVNAEFAIQKKTYANASQAQAQISTDQSTQGLPQVAIGDGISATKQGAAGSTYLTWQEGRWTITVRASTINGEDPLPLAKQAVAWFASNALPVPDSHGTVDLSVTTSNTRQNQITWTEGSQVFLISGLDPMKTIREGTQTR